jgi:hypothetical protein
VQIIKNNTLVIVHTEQGDGQRRFFCPYLCGKKALLYVLAKLCCFSLYYVPKIVSKHSPLAQEFGWVYFLLEVFTNILELAGRMSFKSISKLVFPLPVGANPLLSTQVSAAVAWGDTDLLWSYISGPFKETYENKKNRKSLGHGLGGGHK